jgi:hypothetical protein
MVSTECISLFHYYKAEIIISQGLFIYILPQWKK